MARRIIGLDLGAYSVKLLRLETGNQAPRFEVQDVIEEVLPYEDGDEKDLSTLQSEAVLRLFKRGLLEGEIYASGIPGACGQMSSMTVPFSDNYKIGAVLPGLLDAELPFELDEMTVSWYRPEKQPAVLESGEKSDSSFIRLAFGKKSHIAQTLQMLQQVAVDPRQLHLETVAPYELVRELGCESLFYSVSSDSLGEVDKSLGAIIDFGHNATNLCLFNSEGIAVSKTILCGGKNLSQDIAMALNLTFVEAQSLKHELLNFNEDPSGDSAHTVNSIAKEHYRHLKDQILRFFISCKTSGLGQVASVAFIGGGAQALGLKRLFEPAFTNMGTNIVSLESSLPENTRAPSMAMALAYAISCLHVHVKENRFNFRKDEFAWRGELDFLRTKSVPLVLWGLTIICSFTVMWAASSMILEKENSIVEAKLKTACTKILGKKDINPKKCLTLMKEQMAASVDVGIPEHTASDIYLDMAKFLPSSLKISISEMDITEKRVRLVADTQSFEEVDKVVAELGKIPCFVKVEGGRAQKLDKTVRFNPSSDIDCNAKASETKAQPRGI